MKKSNNIKFIFLIVGVVLIVVGLIYQIFFNSKSSNVNDNNNNDKNNNGDETRVIYNYKCTKQLYSSTDFTVTSTIGFAIDNLNKILSNYTDYEYQFSSLETFNNFDDKLGINATPIVKDSSKMYIKYSYGYSEEKKDNETKDEYINRLTNEMKFKCELDN